MSGDARNFSELQVERVKGYGLAWRLFHRILWKLYIKIFPGREMTVRSGSGKCFRLRVGDQISEILFTQGVYEPQLTSILMPLVKPGMTIFDIGANIGYYSILMAEKVGPRGSVHCFEINDNILKLLEGNIKLSGAGNIRVVRQAVSDKNGRETFYVPSLGDEGEGSLRPSGRYKAEGTMEVETTTLDSFIEKNGIPKVDLIKIDVEGGEFLAFEGAKKLLSSKDRPIIMFEALDTACANFGHTWIDSIEKVKSFGYRIYQGDTANYIAIPER